MRESNAAATDFCEDRIVRPGRKHVQPLWVRSAQQDLEERSAATALPEIVTENGQVDATDLVGTEVAFLREHHVLEVRGDGSPNGAVPL